MPIGGILGEIRLAHRSIAPLYLNSNPDEILKILKEKNLIADQLLCTGTSKKPHEEKHMKWKVVKPRKKQSPKNVINSTRKESRRKRRICKQQGHDGMNWRCNTCGTRKSIRGGSFFEITRISLIIVFKLIIHWVLETRYKGNLYISR
jgi:hypothetical protein